ncbi:hypothetical protein [Streptomyces melanogenes]|uniref:Secreted protein n=1 Tax=Streptomyces melanogenes TaxID=67326 RepID=A0ABZ1XBR0_9ACTN|nr:hypothetical protein [Streptomyces melanogenes]
MPQGRFLLAAAATAAVSAVALSYIQHATAPAGTLVEYSAQDLCGASYRIIDQHHLAGTGDNRGTTAYLGYDQASKSYCTITVRDRQTAPTDLATRLQATGYPADTRTAAAADYADPVFTYPRGSCVTWGGTIQHTTWDTPTPHCSPS